MLTGPCFATALDFRRNTRQLFLDCSLRTTNRSALTAMPLPRYLFVTGRLAEQPLRRLLAGLAEQVGFEYDVAVMPITVAALITPRWLARRIRVPEGTTCVLVPGHCQGDLVPLEEAAGVPVRRGPRDFRELPEFFGHATGRSDYGDWDIELLATITKASERTVDAVVEQADRLTDDGADVIVLEGQPDRPWPRLVDAVRALRGEGHRVAVARAGVADTRAAVEEGIKLALPHSHEQCLAVAELGCEVVVTWNDESDWAGLEQTVGGLTGRGAAFRIDPGLRPIGRGVAASLVRLHTIKERWPDIPRVMSLDAITETSGVDAAGLHLMLLGLCQELGVGSVLVSQEANWNRTAVRECHQARQVTHYAAQHRGLARDVDPELLMLRDGATLEFGAGELDRLAEVLKDPSPRIFAEGDRLHAVRAGSHLESEDPYDLFDQLQATGDRKLDAAEAFYVGYEMAKAVTALTLGKTYRQDEALDWGLLSQRELTRLERRALRMARLRAECDETDDYFESDEPADAWPDDGEDGTE